MCADVVLRCAGSTRKVIFDVNPPVCTGKSTIDLRDIVKRLLQYLRALACWVEAVAWGLATERRCS